MAETVEMEGISIKVNTVNGDSGLHSIKELVDMAFEASSAEKFLDNLSTNVAPHWHRQALRIGREVRESHPDASNEEICELCRDTLKGIYNNELERLIKERDYPVENKKLPGVADSAFRKILDFWGKGGDERNTDTLNQMYEYTREQRKKAQKAAAEKYGGEETNGEETATPNGGEASEAFANLPDSVKSILPELERALRDASKANEQQAHNAVAKCIRSLENIPQQAVKAAAGRAQSKDKAA